MPRNFLMNHSKGLTKENDPYLTHIIVYIYKYIYIYIYTAQLGFRVNYVLMVAFTVVYDNLEKSFYNNRMKSKVEFKVPFGNCLHLKRLGVTLQKLQNDQ